MDSRGTHKAGNREERLFVHATYGDVLQGDSIYNRPGGWHRVLTIYPTERSQLRIRMTPLQQDGGPIGATVSPSTPLNSQLRRPIGCVDDAVAGTVRRLLLDDWADVEKLLNIAQVRVAPSWERRTTGFGGRNWVTKPQAQALYELVHAKPDVPVLMLLEQVGVTVLHVPPTTPEAGRADYLARVMDGAAEALENLAAFGSAEPQHLNHVALDLRDATAKYRNGVVA